MKGYVICIKLDVINISKQITGKTRLEVPFFFLIEQQYKQILLFHLTRSMS